MAEDVYIEPVLRAPERAVHSKTYMVVAEHVGVVIVQVAVIFGAVALRLEDKGLGAGGLLVRVECVAPKTHIGG